MVTWATTRALGIIAPLRLDTGQCAQRRTGAVGSHQQTRGQRLAAGKLQLNAVFKHVEAMHLRRAQPAHAGALQRLPQLPLHQAVLDDVAEQIASLGGRIEMDRGARRRIPDMHVRIRTRARVADGRPYIEFVEQRDRRRRQTDHAQIDLVLGRPRRGSPRFEQGRGESRARQRQRGGRTYHAATDDRDIQGRSTAA